VRSERDGRAELEEGEAGDAGGPEPLHQVGADEAGGGHLLHPEQDGLLRDPPLVEHQPVEEEELVGRSR